MHTRTDPTGRCFVSYRSTQRACVDRLCLALSAFGVPYWLDSESGAVGPLARVLDEAMDDPTTSSALLWVSPDSDSSAWVAREHRRLSARTTKARDERDPFFVTTVAASGLDADGVTSILRKAYGPGGLASQRHFLINSHDELTWDEAIAVAETVARKRLSMVAAASDAPLVVRLSSFNAPHEPGDALAINWTAAHQPEPAIRLPRAGLDTELLQPSLRRVVSLLGEFHARGVTITGKCSLSMAFLVGCAISDKGLLRDSAWLQGGAVSLNTEPAESGYVRGEPEIDIAGADGVAVFAGGTDKTTLSEIRSLVGSAREFAAVIEVGFREGRKPNLSVHQMAHAAAKIAEGIQRVRQEAPSTSDVHLFMAVPAPVAYLVGMRVGTIPRVHLYEIVSDVYVESFLCTPQDARS